MTGTGFALQFAGGAGGYVSAPYTFPTDTFSILFWYSTSSLFANDEGWLGQSGSLLIFKQGSNDIQFYAYLNASADFSGPRRLRIGRNLSNPITDGLWHSRAYIVYVNSTGHGSVDEYEDGTFKQTGSTDYTGDTSSPSGNLCLGTDISNSKAFNGSMDRIAIYNRKLGAQDVTDFNNKRVPYSPAALWQFDEGIGTMAADTSGNGHTGYFAGSGTAPVWISPGISNPVITGSTPSPMIKFHSQTSMPVSGDATLVDDTATLVDDTKALGGGPTIISPNIASKVVPAVPRPAIRRRR